MYEVEETSAGIAILSVVHVGIVAELAGAGEVEFPLDVGGGEYGVCHIFIFIPIRGTGTLFCLIGSCAP